MKWFFTSAVTARALASEHDPALDLSPPVITLDMEGGAVYSSTAYGQQARQTTPDHPMCSGTQHADQVYSKTCQVLFDTPTSCAEPTPNAYDHHDGIRPVVTGLKLFIRSLPGQLPEKVDEPVSSLPTGPSDVYSQRGEFVIVYSTEDASGNQAETLSFSMVMADEIPPVFDLNIFSDFATKYSHLESMDMTQHTSERASALYDSAVPQERRRQYFKLPSIIVAVDAYDGTVAVHPTVTDPSGATVVGSTVDTSVLGTWTAHFVAHDAADVFGLHSLNNTVVSQTVTFQVHDTQPPVLHCRPQAHGASYVDVTLVGQPFHTVAVADLSECAGLCFASQWQSTGGAACQGFAFKSGVCNLHTQIYNQVHPGAPDQGYVLGQCGMADDLVNP